MLYLHLKTRAAGTKQGRRPSPCLALEWLEERVVPS
jgi:hypothetical protein